MKISTQITKGPVTRKIEQTDETSGSSLKGYVDISYQDLVTAFGPSEGPSGDYKVTHGWSVKIDGEIVTIYDYKEDLNTGKVEQWHVGGFSQVALERIEELFGNTHVRYNW